MDSAVSQSGYDDQNVRIFGLQNINPQAFEGLKKQNHRVVSVEQVVEGLLKVETECRKRELGPVNLDKDKGCGGKGVMHFKVKKTGLNLVGGKLEHVSPCNLVNEPRDIILEKITSKPNSNFQRDCKAILEQVRNEVNVYYDRLTGDSDGDEDGDEEMCVVSDTPHHENFARDCVSQARTVIGMFNDRVFDPENKIPLSEENPDMGPTRRV